MILDLGDFFKGLVFLLEALDFLKDASSGKERFQIPGTCVFTFGIVVGEMVEGVVKGLLSNTNGEIKELEICPSTRLCPYI